MCITPGGGPASDLVLTYPAHDPSTLSEYFGMAMDAANGRKLAVNGDYVPKVGSAAGLALQSVSPQTGAAFAAASSVTCPVSGADTQPRGRSFWNHRFVHGLRHAALEERSCATHVGTVRRVVLAQDVRTDPSLAHLRSSLPCATATPALAPKFAGYDAKEDPIPYAGPRAAAPSGDAAPAPSSSSSSSAAAVPRGYDDLPDETVVGVAWTDEAGNERVTLSRLSIVADGMYSTFRGALHAETKCPIVSYFCGLVLHHPPGQRYILPYPHRGHVIMADPNPVLLYQVRRRSVWDAGVPTRVLFPQRVYDLQQALRPLPLPRHLPRPAPLCPSHPSDLLHGDPRAGGHARGAVPGKERAGGRAAVVLH